MRVQLLLITKLSMQLASAGQPGGLQVGGDGVHPPGGRDSGWLARECCGAD